VTEDGGDGADYEEYDKFVAKSTGYRLRLSVMFCC
jgi:hypothetical protein